MPQMVVGKIEFSPVAMDGHSAAIYAELSRLRADNDRLRSDRTILLDSAKDVIAWCDKTGSGDALYCIDRLRHAIATVEAGKPTSEVENA